MNFIKMLMMFFTLYLITINVQAQTTLNSNPESTIKTTSVSINTSTASINGGNVNSISSTTTSESIPTPEQQGFDKMTINGKTVYVKTENGVTVTFIPNNY